jgi:S-adenosylmethionine synthetase
VEHLIGSTPSLHREADCITLTSALRKPCSWDRNHASLLVLQDHPGPLFDTIEDGGLTRSDICATAETPELMPLPILLAHRLSRSLAVHRRNGEAWLCPDVKTQVSVRYGVNGPQEVTDVLVSTQHPPEVEQEPVRTFVADTLLPEALSEWHHPGIRITVNPTGSFVQGGPSADCGVTGRKVIVDTYGGMGRHGGGAFSGTDPSKVDRSGAYFCRDVARKV